MICWIFYKGLRLISFCDTINLAKIPIKGSDELIAMYMTVIDNDDDKSAFEKLYKEYRREMYGIAYSILHKKEDAEDAVHQAFLQISYDFDKIRSIPCHELRAYIVIIIRNASINIYNSNKKREERTIKSYDDDAVVEIDFFENFDFEVLVERISELPDIYKDVLFLRYVEEFSTKEVSRMLGLSENTVRKRTERAKKLLKDALERNESYAE